MHANSASSALRRLMASPLNLGVNELSLISAIVVVKRLWLDDKWSRKVVSVDEICLDKGRLRLRRIFSWNNKLKTHIPLTTEEVVKSSVKLKEVIDSRDEQLIELENRRNFLEKLRRLKIYDSYSIAKELLKFYRLREDRTRWLEALI